MIVACTNRAVQSTVLAVVAPIARRERQGTLRTCRRREVPTPFEAEELTEVLADMVLDPYEERTILEET